MNYINKFVNTSKLSHAYIAGGDLTFELSKAALCSNTTGGDIPCGCCKNCLKVTSNIHPDVFFIDILKDKQGIGVNQIRYVKTDAYVAPNEAERRVYVVNNADTMTEEAQNAFLQLLEEPPAHAVFILSTSNPAALLPTVRSRCINLAAVAELPCKSEDSSEILALAAEFTNALNDNLKLTQCMFKLEKLDKKDFSCFINLARDSLGRLLHDRSDYKSITAADALLTQAAEMLDLNISASHISGMLCASLIISFRRNKTSK